MFNALFSQILGSLGGAAGGMTGAGAASAGGLSNPFSNLLGSAAGLVGGPASGPGTLFSLPNELLTGVADLGTSENILGDIAGLAKPVMGLGDKALGGVGGNLLSGLNPFGAGPDSGKMEAILRALMPVGIMTGLSAAAAGLNRRQYGEEALP